MKFKFTRQSSNAKTGPIPVTMTERASCPDTCPLKKNGCYADNFPLSLHWDRVADTGTGLNDLCAQIAALPEGQLWRHNVAGDLPHASDGRVSTSALNALVAANRGKRGFTYTHHRVAGHSFVASANQYLIHYANAFGFTVNASCQTAEEAVHVMKEHSLPTVCILPKGTKEKSQKVDGVQVVTCPATIRDNVTCATCGLCSQANRKFVIGFPAHGAQAKKAEAAAA